jgi:hypothetical protein
MEISHAYEPSIHQRSIHRMWEGVVCCTRRIIQYKCPYFFVAGSLCFHHLNMAHWVKHFIKDIVAVN